MQVFPGLSVALPTTSVTATLPSAAKVSSTTTIPFTSLAAGSLFMHAVSCGSARLTILFAPMVLYPPSLGDRWANAAELTMSTRTADLNTMSVLHF